MNILILLAAGFSKRFGKDKLLENFNGRPIILHALAPFRNTRTIIAANKNNTANLRRLAPAAQIILGGRTRQESVNRAIKFLQRQKSTQFHPAPNDLIIIHNAANPFASKQEIKKCLILAKRHGAAIVGHRPVDTVKLARGRFIEKTIPRSQILLSQTPQIFKWKILCDAHKNASAKNIRATDDAGLVEAAGCKIAWTKDSPQNKKITFSFDLPRSPRIGVAADSHEFSNSGVLVLAGLKFARYKKLKADSDGDVILHGLSAAISQALGNGALGTFATPMCKKGTIDSKKYLAHILSKISAAGYKISNIGIHIETSKIKIDPIAKNLRAGISRLTKTPETNIGITANSGVKNPNAANSIKCVASVILN